MKLIDKLREKSKKNARPCWNKFKIRDELRIAANLGQYSITTGHLTKDTVDWLLSEGLEVCQQSYTSPYNGPLEFQDDITTTRTKISWKEDNDDE